MDLRNTPIVEDIKIRLRSLIKTDQGYVQIIKFEYSPPYIEFEAILHSRYQGIPPARLTSGVQIHADLTNSNSLDLQACANSNNRHINGCIPLDDILTSDVLNRYIH